MSGKSYVCWRKKYDLNDADSRIIQTKQAYAEEAIWHVKYYLINVSLISTRTEFHIIFGILEAILLTKVNANFDYFIQKIKRGCPSLTINKKSFSFKNVSCLLYIPDFNPIYGVLATKFFAEGNKISIVNNLKWKIKDWWGVEIHPQKLHKFYDEYNVIRLFGIRVRSTIINYLSLYIFHLCSN